MNKMTGFWPWPVHHSLHQRLRSSEYQRLRSGALAAPELANRGPVAPVRHLVCQWAHGEPKAEDFRFCSAPVLPGKPYCPAHCAIAYLLEDGAAEPYAQPTQVEPTDPAVAVPEQIAPDELWPDPPPPPREEEG
ncbi:GcrA family cell cycle regulator [Plastoroseomonas hellenica]|uniref:GcrA family cell cycle regulator n=1 Tax=Plastoroseomonas hellenica TaxID=2687306 RepID=UPI001BA7D0BA|nr:GcrA family cell cycle regulator [Plastoroseomonas hellenica]MBR0647540.1 hypothetical protein [Plastoroseomonas hellenica]